jgi:hypothetical protein
MIFTVLMTIKEEEEEDDPSLPFDSLARSIIHNINNNTQWIPTHPILIFEDHRPTIIII